MHNQLLIPPIQLKIMSEKDKLKELKQRLQTVKEEIKRKQTIKKFYEEAIKEEENNISKPKN